MLVTSNISLYQALLNKNFFLDKFNFKNVYQCPVINTLSVKIMITSVLGSKGNFYKILIFLYLLTGQKPSILIEKYSVRGIKKKKIKFIFTILRKSNLNNFLKFIVFRKLSFLSFSNILIDSKSSLRSSWAIEVQQRSNDDELLLHLLKIADEIKYYFNLSTSSRTSKELRTLLINYKIPC